MDTTRLQGIARAYSQSAVLFTAIDIDLFTHIDAGANTQDELVRATGLRALDIPVSYTHLTLPTIYSV